MLALAAKWRNGEASKLCTASNELNERNRIGEVKNEPLRQKVQKMPLITSNLVPIALVKFSSTHLLVCYFSAFHSSKPVPFKQMQSVPLLKPKRDKQVEYGGGFG